MSYKMSGSELMKSGKRFSNAMWEYTWMLQRTGRQNEYADWDKVLDEVVERGYDCLRIDPFPHQIARGKDGRLIEEFENVVDYNYMWTCYQPAKYNPRKSLKEFMQKCKDRGIYVGLSSWYRRDTTHRELELETAEDYARIWTETLDFLAENDLLDGITWVDLCNEFPLDNWAPALKETLIETVSGQTQPVNVVASSWEDPTPESVERYSDFMKRAINPVREKYPQLLYTFSIAHSMMMKKLDYSCCDILDIHVWADHYFPWMVANGFMDMNEVFKPGESNMLTGHQASKIVEHIEKCCTYYPMFKYEIAKFLENETKEWAQIAKKADALLVTTEAWASIVYEDVFLNGALGEWDWFKEVCEMGVRAAVKNGWTSICTSNFCEPQFEGMWYDVDWHRKMNEIIKN